MKMKKRIIYTILLIVINLCISACGANKRIIYMWYSESDSNNSDKIEIKDIDDYEYKYSDCYTNMQFESLNAAEKDYYKIIVYMVENGYNTVYIYDKNIGSDMSTQFERAYFAASLDCPFIESSLKLSDVYNEGEYEAYLGNVMTLDEIEKSIDEAKIRIDEAVEFVQNNHTENETEIEQIGKRIYLNFISKVKYDSARSNAYNALIDSTANCDGIAKAIEMMFNMVGINTGVVTVDEEKDIEGHAWNVMELNGKCYHIDGTLGVSLHGDFYDSTEKVYLSSYKIPDEFKMKGITYSIYCDVGFNVENDYSMIDGVIKSKNDFYKIYELDKYECGCYFVDADDTTYKKLLKALTVDIENKGYKYNVRGYTNKLVVVNIW